jgi:hypothetical protein
MMTPLDFQQPKQKLKVDIQVSSDSLFSFGRVNALPLYYLTYHKIPNEIEVNFVSVEKAHAEFVEKYGSLITNSYNKRRQLDGENEKLVFDDIFYFFGEDGLIVFDRNCNNVYIFYRDTAYSLIKEIEDSILTFLENHLGSKLGLITGDSQGLSITDFSIKQIETNLSLNYNDDLLPINDTIQNRLKADKDKGLILLYGEPGTGKTTYIRYLIGQINKKVLFVSPQLAEELHSPQLLKLLMENRNCILVIEDAEKILTSRENEKNSAVTTLLNLTDGLLSDCLNIQIICSFNTSINKIDQALYRKGRLIAKYKFEKLAVDKANKLAENLGYSVQFDQPTSLTEVFNWEEQHFQNEKMKVIGF